jgi:hypothetical protein
MFMFVLILIGFAGTGGLLFHLQALCQKLMGRRLTRKFYEPIVTAHQLEFPLVRKAVENFGSSGECSRLTVTLKCDFLAVTYLLRNASNFDQRVTYEDRLLMLYFKVLFVSLITRHRLGLRKNSTVLKLTTILQYFADVVGERVSTVRFEPVTAADFLLDS